MKNDSKVKSQKTKVLGAVLLVVLLSSMLRAEVSYPQPGNKYVNDFAGILAETDRSTMAEALKGLKERAGIEMTVVTIKSLADYGAEETGIESYAGGIFKQWAIGEDARGMGIMMLVSTGDRKIKVETGEALGADYEEKMLDIIEKYMVPFFKQGYYSRGIYEGVRQIIKKTDKKPVLAELDMPAAGAAIAAFFLTGLIYLMVRGRKKSKNGGQAEKSGGINDLKARPPVKTEKIRREPPVFGGGSSGTW